MKTTELLMLAARAGVEFWLDGDRLAYRAPQGAMTPELRAQVVGHKADLIRMLQRDRFEAPQPIAAAPSCDGDGPLASGQERIWLIERRVGPSPLHNVHFRLLWRGVLDRETLALAIGDVTARHAALRTAFPEVDGVPRAVVAPAAAIEVVHLDLRGHAPAAKARAAEEFACAQERTPFDVQRGPLIRAAAITLADDDHIVLVTQHHIVTDGWSVGIFLAELGQHYRARRLGARPEVDGLPLAYADYARWQHKRRAEPGYAEHVTWWKEHLAGLSPLVFQREGPAPPDTPGYHGALQDLRIPADLASRLKDLAKDQHCTLYTVLLAAWAMLLYRHTGRSDFAIGTVTSGRDRIECQPLIGFFANTVVLRCDLSGNPSAAEAIGRLRAETEAAFQREVQFADVVLAAGAVRDASLSPLVQAAFVFENIPMPETPLTGNEPAVAAEARIDPRIDSSVEGTTKFDLALFIKGTQDDIDGYLRYATARLDPGTVQRLAERFGVLLESIVRDPSRPVGRLEFMSARERQLLLVDWNDRDSLEL